MRAPLMDGFSARSIVSSWPEEGMERVYGCPVCQATKRETLYEGLTDRLFGAPGKWTLRRCIACRSAYLDPRPTPDCIAMAYRRYYTHESQGNEAARRYFNYESLGSAAGTGRKRGLAGWKTRLRFGYLNHRYNLTLQPASPLGRWIVPWFPIRRSEIDRWMRNLSLPRPGARLLDVGCGNGAFLRLASSIGWDAWGLEPDPTAAAAARMTDLQVREGQLPDTGLPSNSCDAITLSHVIEHLHDPVRALQELFRILVPDGKLWIATPNVESPLHSRFGRHWRGLEPPRHLVLFNRWSLITACRENGFDPVVPYKQPPSAAWLTQASRHIERGNNPFSGSDYKLSLAERIRTSALDRIAALRFGRGEELVVIATKPTT